MVLAKSINTNGETNVHYAFAEQNIGIALKTVNLFNGWGFTAIHSSSFASSDTDYHNRNTSLKLKLFLQESADLNILLNHHKYLNSNGIVSTHFLIEAKPQFIENSSQLVTNINIGKDQSFFNVKMTSNIVKTKNEDINDNNVFRESNNYLTDISFAWRVSEDSFVTAKFGNQYNDYFQLNKSFSSTTIINSYIGFKTSYLGASQLRFDIGSSNVKGTNNSLSWQLINETNINDYFKVSLSNGRKFSVTKDFRFDVDLNTYSNFNITYSPNNYYSIKFNADSNDGIVDSSFNTKTTVFNLALDLNYLTSWSSSAYIKKSEYKDDRALFDYQQTEIGFQISRDLI